ncbi:ABC transporter substrate-binding protein [Virgisporangium ochraceum]|uniref:ABC transporter n=1 Tax=Virgisporangium ochraceum TaxID=65505 RepID=A0A8J4A8M6_9ACTN|nr:ABC transporter substrate-binding protein [Virgisporangium ochraceum]GIJ75380.1 ABC transporter [Virgisporangium ochraceum]
MRRALVAVVLLPLVTSCGDRDGAPSRPAPRPQTVALVDDARGPAPAVPGAKRGGTVTALIENEFEHLDPGRTYVARAQSVNLLLQRTLTAYRRTPAGQLELVGDLATDTGRPSPDRRVWTYTLRDGLRFEDGTPIRSGDVAYAIARSFSPALADGPTWLQNWLGENGAGVSPLPPGVRVPDDRTIVFEFPRPQPDLPFAVTLGNTTPVPKDRDTGAGYDLRPVATGPYRIESYRPGERLTLVRNPHWDPRSDPVRHDHPDRFVVEFGQSAGEATERVLSGERTTVSLEQVPPEMLAAVADNRAIAQHATVGSTPYVGYLKINVARVTDLAVRRALNCAMDRDGYLSATGGRALSEPATTLLPRNVVGFRAYNAYDCGPAGDPSRARKMLGGRTVALRFGYRDSGRGPAVAAFLERSLAAAGFDLELVPIPPNRYYSTIGTRDNGLDVYIATWSADWPSGAAVIPALVDGRTIAAKGNSNTSYLDDPVVDAEIDRIRAIDDLAEAGREWSRLDERLMRDIAPVVPVFYDRTCALNGLGVDGLYLHEVLGVTSLTTAFVT